MSVHLDSYARFFDALATSLAYAESSDFHHPELQPGLLAELRAIRAWTARGRTPRVAERATVSFAWALMRTRDGGPEEPPAHAQQLEIARSTVVFFRNWPDNAADAKREREALVTVPRVPTRDEIAVVLRHIRDEVSKIPHAQIWPLAAAFESKEPLMRDTMTTPQWVRWVLVPRLEEIVDGTTRLPAQSQLCTLARDLASDEATWPLLYTLGELDDLFVTSLAEALRKSRAGT